MKYFLNLLFVLTALLMVGCTHCDFGPFSRGTACLPCDYELIQGGETADMSKRPTFRLRIRVVDDVGTPVSSGGLCPGFYYEGTRLGAEAFEEVERGVFEGHFPAQREAWAVLNIRTKDPKPFGRGMYRFSLRKDTDVIFTLSDWTRKSKIWRGRREPVCITCTGDSNQEGAISYAETIEVDQKGRSKPILVPRDLTIKVQYNDGSPFARPGLCAEVFLNDIVEPFVSWDLNKKGKTSRSFYSPKYVERPELFEWTVQIRWQEDGVDYNFSQHVLGGVPRQDLIFRLPFSPPIELPEEEVEENSEITEMDDMKKPLIETPPLGVAVVEELDAEDLPVELPDGAAAH